jgi:hypothetical protein
MLVKAIQSSKRLQSLWRGPLARICLKNLRMPPSPQGEVRDASPARTTAPRRIGALKRPPALLPRVCDRALRVQDQYRKLR